MCYTSSDGEHNSDTISIICAIGFGLTILVAAVLVKSLILLPGRWMFRVGGSINVALAGHVDTPPFVICVRRKSQLAASLHPG